MEANDLTGQCMILARGLVERGGRKTVSYSMGIGIAYQLDHQQQQQQE